MQVRASTSISFRLTARWLLRAVSLLALGAAFGYALGLATVILRLKLAEMAQARATSGVPVQTGLLASHSSDLLLYRYSDLDPYFYASIEDFFLNGVLQNGISSTFLLFFVVFVGLLAARQGERVLAPMRFHNVPREDIAGIQAIWRNAIQTSSPRAWLIALTGLCIGFSGAWAGAWSSALESAWWTGPPRKQLAPGQIMLPFRLWDGVWVLGGTALAALLLAAVPARRRLIRTGELARRFCVDCGYPRPATSTQTGTCNGGGSVPELCPECGRTLAQTEPPHTVGQKPPAT